MYPPPQLTPQTTNNSTPTRTCTYKLFKRKTQVISTSNYENLENFISDSRKDLTHLIVDENPDLPEFLQDVYYNEEKYVYLIKEFDSKEMGFEHHIKLFKINFQKFDSINNRLILEQVKI